MYNFKVYSKNTKIKFERFCNNLQQIEKDLEEWLSLNNLKHNEIEVYIY